MAMADSQRVTLKAWSDLAARIGVVTRQGMIGLIRQKYGARSGTLSAGALVLANVGTMTAEFAGIAAAGQLFGLSKYVSVPVAAIAVSFLVLRNSFSTVEKVFFIVSAGFIAYIIAGFMAGPDWGAAAKGVLIPTIPFTQEAIFIATATIGTTLAPWGLAFIQSYAVDKRLTNDDLKLLRVDVWTGSLLTGVIGFFVVVTCAATLHKQGIHINDAADAAKALEPLVQGFPHAGTIAKILFAIGVIGMGLLGIPVLAGSVAYAVSDAFNWREGLDYKLKEAKQFYGVIIFSTVAGWVITLVGIDPIKSLVFAAVINGLVAVPLIFLIARISRNKEVMGELTGKGLSRTMLNIAFVVMLLCALMLIGTTIFS